MGTRGLFVVKWRGRYYVYYNHWDSYPGGLGQTILEGIPDGRQSPSKYEEWLRALRARFSRLKDDLDRQVLTISIQTLLDGQQLGRGGLERYPTFVMVPTYPAYPYYEWCYTVDLDREAFIVNLCCMFDLRHVPSCWQSLLPQAKQYFFGNEAARVHESILPKADRTCLSNLQASPQEHLSSYLRLNPTVLEPLRKSHLNRQPHFAVGKHLFDWFTRSSGYNDIISTAAKTALHTTEVLFRESVFILLCLASCSTELVRLIPSTNIIFPRQDKGHFLWDEPKFVGINHGDNPTSKSPSDFEFASRPFEGFHLPNTRAQCSPESDHYWLGDILILLVLELESEAQTHRSICKVAEIGRATGKTTFNAIIATPVYVVLVRVLADSLQHSKVLPLVAGMTRDRGNGNHAEQVAPPEISGRCHLERFDRRTKQYF
ncbi:hypothetical protein M011DRAFT_231055 [Sporormia fimetaria CBS 119925]|uniref:Uncharacterized protein n=1 Tax=Sporormia fimetaria CBS 119925 TaxID=1340428 RepID=A0A6A6VLV6_9PLEO|nr:hypothetical protein M011DRAFT_231055 [Sporormia fimetaria CBS 119925]